MGWRRSNFISFSQMARWSVITHWWRLTYWVSVWNLYSLPRICTDCYELCSGAQSCPTLCDPKDLSLPGSSSHGILLARILKHVAISSSRGSSRPRDGACISCVSCIGRQVLSLWATREALLHPPGTAMPVPIPTALVYISGLGRKDVKMNTWI